MLQENQNGVILGYHILLSDAWGVSLRNATFQNSRQTYYQFQDLEAWANYSVKLSAFTSKGNGPYSTSLLANTEEDGILSSIFFCERQSYFFQRLYLNSNDYLFVDRSSSCSQGPSCLLTAEASKDTLDSMDEKGFIKLC